MTNKAVPAELRRDSRHGGTKRKAAASGGTGAAALSLSDIDFKALAAAGELETVTGAKLKVSRRRPRRAALCSIPPQKKIK